MKNRQLRDFKQEYRNRASNFGFSGCLDALDYIPAGSVKSSILGYYDQSFIERGRTLAEVQAESDAVDLIIDEILKEEQEEEQQ